MVDLATVSGAKQLKPDKMYRWRAIAAGTPQTMRSIRQRFTVRLAGPTSTRDAQALVPNPSQTPYPVYPTVRVTVNSVNAIHTAIAGSLQTPADPNSNCKPQHTVIELCGTGTGFSGRCPESFIVTTPSVTTSNGSAAFREIKCRVTIIGNSRPIARATGTNTPKFRIFTVVRGGYLTLDQVKLENGSADDWGGGAVYNYLGRLDVLNSTIQKNEVDLYFPGSTWKQFLGGGIYSFNGALLIQNSIIRDNNSKRGATGQGLGLADGGGIALSNQNNDTVSILMNGIASNEAAREGNALYIVGNSKVENNCFTSNDNPSPLPSATLVSEINVSVDGYGVQPYSWQNNWWGSELGPIVNGPSNGGRDSINISQTDVYLPFLTVAPTQCVGLIVATSTPQPSPTPTLSPTPSATPITEAYKIALSSDWSPTDQTHINNAVQKVGEAFQVQFGSMNITVASPQAAFNRVMANGNDPQYVYFFKAPGTSSSVTITYPPDANKPPLTVTVSIGGCFSVNYNGLPRTIVCNWGTGGNYPVYPEHALVHELGHIFTNRSILASSTDSYENSLGLLNAAIQGTFTGTCTPTFAANNIPDPFEDMEFSVSSCLSINDTAGVDGLVMGQDNNSIWRKGERGWGSGPDNVFTPFQQHPLDVFPGDNDATKVDETAADMFLNWVYRRRTNKPPTYKTSVPGTWEGFLNKEWLGNSSGNDDFNYPGDARFEWMNHVMTQIFLKKGW